MRIPLATDIKTRTGAPDKDARQKNSYIEVKGEQAIVRKRPSAQGGVSVGTGTAQGGYGLVLFWADTVYPITSSTLTTCNNATSYVKGDHVTVDAVDYWATGSTSNTCPIGGVAGAEWSTTYIPAEGTIPVVYATWNPLDKSSIVTLSNSDLTASVFSTTNTGLVRSTVGKTTGKWYWEITLTSVGNSTVQELTGIANQSESTSGIVGGTANSWGHANTTVDWGVCFGTGNAAKINNSIVTCYGPNVTSGTVLGFALDMNANTIIVYVNGASQGIMFSGLTGTIYAAFSNNPNTTPDTPVVCTANFGASAFAYSVPSGYNSGLYT